MKEFLLFLAFLPIGIFCYPQDCLPYGLTIYHQEDIEQFKLDYPTCTKILGSLTIQGDSIYDLQGLSQISFIKESLEISETINLYSLNGLHNLDTIIHNCYIYQNDSIQNLSALDNLINVGHNIYISYNQNLTSISSFNALQKAGNRITISDNPNLVSIDGFNNLTSIDESLVISDNPVLASIGGLQALKEIESDLIIKRNEALNNLGGLSELQEIKNDLLISYNKSLNSLSGFDNLKTIGHSLDIVYSEGLTNLKGLESLEYMYGDLNIFNNKNLTNLQGIENIHGKHITDLYILFNDKLSNCAVESVCEYLAHPNGAISVADNATGCQNEAVIVNHCNGLGIGESFKMSQISFHPNPASDRLSLSVPDGINIDLIRILKLSGQQVFETHSNQTTVDISSLPVGLYILELTSSEIVWRNKLLIN